MQLKILSALTPFYDRYDQLISINSHRSGDCVYVDLLISFDKDVTFEQIVKLRQGVAKDLNGILENCVLNLVVREAERERCPLCNTAAPRTGNSVCRKMKKRPTKELVGLFSILFEIVGMLRIIAFVRAWGGASCRGGRSEARSRNWRCRGSRRREALRGSRPGAA